MHDRQRRLEWLSGMRAWCVLIVIALANVMPAHGKAPRIAQSLSAKHTVWFSMLDRPQDIVVLTQALQRWGPEFVPGFDPGTVLPLFDSIGFDLSDPKAWRAVGINADSQIGLFVDDRLISPMIVLKVADADALIRWARARFGAFDIKPAQGRVAEWTLQRESIWAGTRGGYHFFPIQQDAKTRQVLETIMTPDAPLSDSKAFQSVFADYAGNPQLALFFNASTLTFESPESKASLAARVVPLFDMLAAVVDERRVIARGTTTPKGQARLRQLLEPDGAPPDFRRYVANDGFIIRFGLNLVDLLDGLKHFLPQATIPPGVESGDFFGLTLIDARASLSGHGAMVLGGNTLFMLGVKDRKRTAALIRKVLTVFEKMPQTSITPLNGATGDGYRLTLQDSQWDAVQIKDVLLVGETTRVDAARKATNSGQVGALIGGRDAFAVYFDAARLGASFAFGVSPATLALMRTTARKQSTTSIKDYVGARIRFDKRGLLIEGEVPALKSMMNLLGFAIGATRGYARRALQLGKP